MLYEHVFYDILSDVVDGKLTADQAITKAFNLHRKPRKKPFSEIPEDYPALEKMLKFYRSGEMSLSSAIYDAYFTGMRQKDVKAGEFFNGRLFAPLDRVQFTKATIRRFKNQEKKEGKDSLAAKRNRYIESLSDGWNHVFLVEGMKEGVFAEATYWISDWPYYNTGYEFEITDRDYKWHV